MRYLFTGSRKWQDSYIVDLIVCGLAQWAREHREPVKVIHGAARGLDTLAGASAKRMGISVSEWPANWKEFGKRAGPIRNSEMLEEADPKVVFAFVDDDISTSKGTKDMCRKALKKGLPVYLIYRLREGDL
jgi:homoserine dehydrogenase